MPSVSIVVPTYNHAPFLKRAIESVMSQTFSDWELVIINNFSTDNTIEVVESFKDERIKLINFRNDGIIAASRNRGIQNSNSEYIAFLDSDDIWYPSKLEKCMNLIHEKELGLICHDEYLVEDGTIHRTLHYGPEENAAYRNLLYRGNCVSTSATIVKKKALLDVNCFSESPEFNTSEDYDLWLKLSKSGIKMGFTTEVLGEYTHHSSNNSAGVKRHFDAIMTVTKTHFEESSDITNPIQNRLRMGTILYGAARLASKQNMFSLALKYFARALFLNPINPRIYAGIALALLQFMSSVLKGAKHA